MFGNLERAVEAFQIEAVSATYLIRATFKPLGTLSTYLNDRRRNYVRFDQVELQSLSPGRQMRAMKREMMSVNKHSLLLLSVPVAAEAEKVQLLTAKRPVVFYLGAFIVRGDLHVNLDTSDEDLLDDARDFFPVTEASLFPLETMAATPARQIPLLFINRIQVQAYHIHQE